MCDVDEAYSCPNDVGQLNKPADDNVVDDERDSNLIKASAARLCGLNQAQYPQYPSLPPPKIWRRALKNHSHQQEILAQESRMSPPQSLESLPATPELCTDEWYRDYKLIAGLSDE